MKRLTLLLIIGLSLTGTARAQQAGSPPAGIGAASPISISPEEWQELRAARTAAIQANPDLVAENKKLMDRMRALEDKLDAAMVKSDPSIAPIIAKFESGRHAPVTTASTAPSGPPPIK